MNEIKIGGELRPIAWGLNQSIEYCELRSISISKYQEELGSLVDGDGSELRDLIWSGLKDGARRKGIEFTATRYDVGDWLEEMTANDIANVLTTLADTMPKSDGKGKKKEDRS